MRLVIIGCEYAGKTTLANGIKAWMQETMMGACSSSFHDHFVLPFHEGSGPDVDQEIQAVLSMPPGLLEKYSRYMIQYHTSHEFYQENDHMLVNWYYGDAVYAPLYYGYGGPGEYSDRRWIARHCDAFVMANAPDTVIVLVKASADVIRQRMRLSPHPHNLLKEEDVEMVLARFDEEYRDSLYSRRFTLDTSEATAEETLESFIKGVEPHLSDRDLLRLSSHRLVRDA